MIYNCALCNYNSNKKYNITRHNNIKHKNIQIKEDIKEDIKEKRAMNIFIYCKKENL